jgi:hypothetical protein
VTQIGSIARTNRLSGQSMPNERAHRRFQISPFISLVIAIWLFVGVPCLQSQQTKAREFEVKAAYLFNFARFVEWPSDANGGASSSFEICVLGSDPFVPALDATISGQSIGGKSISAKRISKPQEANHCQILFISASEEWHIKDVLAALDKAPVLTVSDIPRFSERGGMIGFVLEGNKVRFEVNLDSAQQAGLTLRSELLKVATNVRKSAHSGDM